MIQPAHLMRLWIWNILQKRGMEKINGLIPVVPVEDHRELAESGMPYIVYGYNIMPRETYHEGAMAFNIYMQQDGKDICIRAIDVMTFSDSGKITEMKAYHGPDDVEQL